VTGPHPAVLVTNAGAVESGDAATVTFPAAIPSGWTMRLTSDYYVCQEGQIGLYVRPGDPYIEIGVYRYTPDEVHALAARLVQALAIQASASTPTLADLIDALGTDPAPSP
jgi:hypothetical protein